MSFFTSISITSWNRKELTEYCIHSILKNTPRENFELIVVDNRSTDGAIPMLKKMHHDGLIDRFFINHQDTFLGTAINLAWREACPEAEWLTTFSNDHLVMAKWFDNLNIVIKDLKLDYVLAHWLMPGFRPGGRQVIETPSGGKYLKRRVTDKFIFGGGLVLRRNIYEKHNIRFPEDKINSPFSVMCARLQNMKLKGVELAKPCSLQQDSKWGDPRYKTYYENIYSKRAKMGDPGYGMRVLRQQQRQGYTPFFREYYEGTNYLNEKNH